MGAAVLELRDAALSYGDRVLWSGLNVAVEPGEFLAVLGGNGSGKTSLLRAIVGLQHLSSGTVLVAGVPARRGSRHIGYVPQQRRIDPLTPLRARDLVAQGVDGHRWGIGWRTAARRRHIDSALESVGATDYADMPVGMLSGGEQQRVRIAQALATDPSLLLCDEPLLSLDMHHQQAVTALVDQRRRTDGNAVVFVTHEINPILPYVDRLLYLADGRFSVGTVDEVMTSHTLSSLYDAPVDVVHAGGRIIVVGVPDAHVHEHHHVAAAVAP